MIHLKQFEFEESIEKNKFFSIIESLLFVSGEPLSLKEISNIIECNPNFTKQVIEELMDIYLKDENRGLKIISLDNKYQLVTKPCNSDYIQKILKINTRQSLSQASLETLAIIAYRQPITRVDIDEIRGVKSESALQRLIERELIKESGRLEVPGRPILYSTTDEFLKQFGLYNLKDLPALDLLLEDGQEQLEFEKNMIKE